MRRENSTQSFQIDYGYHYFPEKEYKGVTYEEGEYESLLVTLGKGEGDNWWCLVYPAFCFTKSENSTNYVYISKIWEIINSVT